MKRTNYQSLLNRAGQLYAQAKRDKGWTDEDLPSGIVSDQIKSTIFVLCDEINKLHERIDKLESKKSCKGGCH